MWRTETAAREATRRTWSRRRRSRGRRTSELTLLLLLLLQNSSLCKVSSGTTTRPFIIPGIKASRSSTAVTSCFSNQLLSKSQRRRRSCDSLHSCPQPLFKMGLRGWGWSKPYSKEATTTVFKMDKMKFNPGGLTSQVFFRSCFLMTTSAKINYGFKSA